MMIESLRWSPLFVMRLNVGYANACHVGETPAGGRSVFSVEGGTFEGVRLRGRVDGGADWVQWRSDGAMIIDVRLTLTTDDGAAIAMTYTGIAYAEPERMARFKQRELLAFEDVYVRTTPRFETADPRYAWLNHVICVANGMRTEDGPIYHVFTID